MQISSDSEDSENKVAVSDAHCSPTTRTHLHPFSLQTVYQGASSSGASDQIPMNEGKHLVVDKSRDSYW